jgi:hypothetical protein
MTIKSKRLRRLQTWTIAVLILYVLMLGYSLVVIFRHAILFAVTAPYYQPMVERHIQSDKTVQELQSDIRVYNQNFSNALQVERDLLHIYFGANVAMIGFLGWSTFVIFRLKREVAHDA